MKNKILYVVIIGLLTACNKDNHEPVPPVVSAPVLLKDIVEEHLPSPYYHFEYDANGNVSFVSFASDFTRYDVTYDHGRIFEMRNNILVNKDRIQYVYGNSGKVELIIYADSLGSVYKTTELFYDGAKLLKLERARKQGNVGFVMEKVVTLTYYDDGNLKDIIYHFLPFEGQPESSSTSHFEQYDNKINVDGFGLLHNEFFDHFFLLPGVTIQKNNPAKEIFTASGLSFVADYTYDYNDKNVPIVKRAHVLTSAGQESRFVSTYSYY